ncbi:MAG TPA: hypothetical protein VGD76_07525 [Ramlibacter sp.]
MRTLIALTSVAALIQLGGCAWDSAEAGDVRPASPTAQVGDATGGHQVHRMFADEKARAVQSELPAQF